MIYPVLLKGYLNGRQRQTILKEAYRMVDQFHSVSAGDHNNCYLIGHLRRTFLPDSQFHD
jgi:hypothetical protein